VALVPSYGAIGAAVALSIGNGTFAGAIFVRARRKLPDWLADGTSVAST
jgi:hypothetical protein